MATYVPPGFRVISALSGSFPSSFSGPTTLYTAPANSVAFLNIFFSVPMDNATVELSIGGVTMIRISRTSSTVFMINGAELYVHNGSSYAPPSNAAFLAVVGPGQSVVRSATYAQVIYSGVLLGT